MTRVWGLVLAGWVAVAVGVCRGQDIPREVAGIYPHLAMFNGEGECGTGAVVPWADRLWVLTYGPHLPHGSTDRLYEITPGLEQIVRSESVGGTPANRMIHRESGQAVLGPYFIDRERNVRVIPPDRMPGRLTGNARHLVDPAGKLYFATMEEGLYEVDVRTLAVTGWIRDGNGPAKGSAEFPGAVESALPGYHGKGLYSGQGRLIYANNGEKGNAALTDPATPSGALAEWTGPGQDWKLVRRNQFTEVTGPGGLEGNPDPERDPVWSVGWDHRSVLLMVLHAGTWHAYRLPKCSRSYDGAHGWNTEWPRIRDIGEENLLLTMHGAFWRFPRSFSPERSAGIVPRSNYLKVIGDFAPWKDRIVFGCDDTAKSEFLNKRRAKGGIAGPGQSQSNLWFVRPDLLDGFGPVLGVGCLWSQDAVQAGQASDPFLFAGCRLRYLHLQVAEASGPVTFRMEVDLRGDGVWETSGEPVVVTPGGYQGVEFAPDTPGVWMRLVPDQDAAGVTACFHLRNEDPRTEAADPVFDALARPGDRSVRGGLLHARGGDFRTLRHVVPGPSGAVQVHDLDAALALKPVDDAEGGAWTAKHVAIPTGILERDAASVRYVDDAGRPWRLPRGTETLDEDGPWGPDRLCREVCTERDLFNAAGIFYELPAENAGGMRVIRPVTTHNRRIHDYASYRGLLVLSGLREEASGERVIRAGDQAAVWVGAVDELWRLGKPRGFGGPWQDTPVRGGEASEPFLMHGFDRKTMRLEHGEPEEREIQVEVDVAGTGHWATYGRFRVPAGEAVEHRFPDAFGAHWVRLTADRDGVVTGQFRYE